MVIAFFSFLFCFLKNTKLLCFLFRMLRHSPMLNVCLCLGRGKERGCECLADDIFLECIRSEDDSWVCALSWIWYLFVFFSFFCPVFIYDMSMLRKKKSIVENWLSHTLVHICTYTLNTRQWLKHPSFTFPFVMYEVQRICFEKKNGTRNNNKFIECINRMEK